MSNELPKPPTDKYERALWLAIWQEEQAARTAESFDKFRHKRAKELLDGVAPNAMRRLLSHVIYLEDAIETAIQDVQSVMDNTHGEHVANLVRDSAERMAPGLRKLEELGD